MFLTFSTGNYDIVNGYVTKRRSCYSFKRHLEELHRNEDIFLSPILTNMVLPTQNKKTKHCNDSSDMNNKNTVTNNCDKSAPNTKLRQSNGNCRTVSDI